MYTLILILHLIVCIGLITVVLLQAGKGGGLSGLFGGGGSDQLFNAPTGMAFIKKVTVTMAVIFMLTSMTMTVLTSRVSMQSVVRQGVALPEPVAPSVPLK